MPCRTSLREECITHGNTRMLDGKSFGKSTPEIKTDQNQVIPFAPPCQHKTVSVEFLMLADKSQPHLFSSPLLPPSLPHSRNRLPVYSSLTTLPSAYPNPPLLHPDTDPSTYLLPFFLDIPRNPLDTVLPWCGNYPQDTSALKMEAESSRMRTMKGRRIHLEVLRSSFNAPRRELMAGGRLTQSGVLTRQPGWT